MDGFDTDTKYRDHCSHQPPGYSRPGMLRPGRFDRKVMVDKPDRRGREAILRVHAKGVPLAPDVDRMILQHRQQVWSVLIWKT